MADYLPNTKSEQSEMLKTLGLEKLEDLFSHLPEAVRLNRPLHLPEGLCEMENKAQIEALSKKNKVYDTCFLGAGAYRHFIPSVVSGVASRAEFVTGYTPYQAEISQGVLQSIFEYQTMMCTLTGLDVSNASVYDGATALAEGVMMCVNQKKNTVLVSEAINPEYMRVLKTWCTYCEVELKTLPIKAYVTDLDDLSESITEDVGAVVLQSPNFFGSFEDMEKASGIIHEKGALFVASVNPISLAVCACPGDYGADVAVGEGQPLGNALGGGGPYLGFMTATKKLMRKLPGRIVGQTLDNQGRRAFVLTLQAREQHIRREKAASNICSNQALNALTAAVYLSAMGPQGLGEVVESCMVSAHTLRDKMAKTRGVTVFEQDFFHEFVVEIDADEKVLEKALTENGILGGYPLGNGRYIYCATELIDETKMDKLCGILAEVTR
ncbi:MAG: aminomethyl-transferring glycine dehydrogenase subunit GcvPA [Eubacteriales bacterium]